MTIFEIQGPDGKIYEVEADNLEQAAQAFAPAEDIQPNPDGTYGQPPEGYVLNPRTGQMTSRAELANNMQPSAATSAAAGAHQGLSFGFGDEFQGAMNAALPGPGTMSERYAFGREQMRAMDDAARRDHAVARGAGEFGGAVATSMIPLGLGSQTAARAGQVAPRAAQVAAKFPFLTRTAGSATSGAGMGGLYGFGAGEGGFGPRAESTRDAAMVGGAFGAAVPLISGAGQRLLDARAGRQAIKAAARAGQSTDDLFTEGRGLYNQIADAGVTVKPTSAVRGYGDVAMGAASEGADRVYPTGVPHPTPAGAASYSLARDAAEKAASRPDVPFADIHTDSKVFGNIAGSNMANESDTRIAAAAKRQFDDWISNLKPEDAVSGDVGVLTSILPKANAVWRRAKKSQMVDKAVDRGQNYLSGGASGIKNQFKSILRNDKLSGQFTPAEQAALRRVIDGTIPEKMLDMFGSGLGQMATTAVGGTAGSAAGPAGTIGGIAVGNVAGQGARRASEAMARRNAEIARAAIASGQLTGNLPTVNPQTRAIIEQILRGNIASAAAN